MPKLRLGAKQEKGGVKSTGPHRVKLLEDKIVRHNDREGKETEFVRYIVEENGEKKMYETRLKSKQTGDLSYLVQRLAEVNEGEEVILQMKREGAKNYIEVIPTSQSSSVEVDEEGEDLSEEQQQNADEFYQDYEE